ncbi:hypothetical protein niasHT_023094 [Heterodera trifolii]|uniref:Uncharacterized protein n=1 Tax=Heterodera trifolii TaxID=157864 RepID=A0ABD2KGH8_9BILA
MANLHSLSKAQLILDGLQVYIEARFDTIDALSSPNPGIPPNDPLFTTSNRHTHCSAPDHGHFRPSTNDDDVLRVSRIEIPRLSGLAEEWGMGRLRLCRPFTPVSRLSEAPHPPNSRRARHHDE